MSLLEEASNSNRDRPASKVLDAEVLAQGRAEQVKAKVRLREVGQTRVQLTSLELAPGTAGTLHELTDLGLRPPQPTAPLSEAAVAPAIEFRMKFNEMGKVDAKQSKAISDAESDDTIAVDDQFVSAGATASVVQPPILPSRKGALRRLTSSSAKTSASVRAATPM